MRLFNGIFWSGLVILSYGCKSGDRLASNGRATEPESFETMDLRPDWLVQRPSKQGAYIGIGAASKTTHPLDYSKVAKKNALEDLASEIAVSVSANSILYLLEQDDQLQEQYQQSIRTETAIDLENFEILGQWETADEYWVYYELDKLVYRQQIEAKQQAAAELAYNWLVRAEELHTKGQSGEALSALIHAFEAMEDYLNQSIVIQRESQKVDVGRRLSDLYFDVIGDLKATTQPTAIELTTLDKVRGNHTLEVTIQNTSGRGIGNLPVLLQFDRPGMKSIEAYTAPNGSAQFQLGELPRTTFTTRGHLYLDVSMLSETAPDQPLHTLLERKSHLLATIPIGVRPPVFSIESGSGIEDRTIAQTIEKSIKNRAYGIAMNGALADAFVKWTPELRQVDVRHPLVGVELVGSLTIEKEGVALSSYTIGPFTGVGTEHEKAARDAYRQAAENLEFEVMRRFFNELEGY